MVLDGSSIGLRLDVPNEIVPERWDVFLFLGFEDQFRTEARSSLSLSRDQVMMWQLAQTTIH